MGTTLVCITSIGAVTLYSGSCGSADDTWVTIYDDTVGACVTTQLGHPTSGC